jgi:hypothetical protein
VSRSPENGLEGSRKPHNHALFSKLNLTKYQAYITYFYDDQMGPYSNLRRRLTRPLVVWPVVALVLELLVQRYDKMAKWLTLLPLVPMLLFIVELARNIRRMDEMQQRVSVVSMAIAFVLTLAVTLVFIGLERAHLWMPPWSDIGTYMLLLWGSAYLVTSWRYR